MKIFKRIAVALGGCLIAAILVLFLMGFRSNANHLVATLVIGCPPAQLWTWIAEPEGQKRWISWLTKIDQEDTGEFRWTMVDPTMNNRAVHIDGKRTAFQPPREFGAHIASEGMFEGDISYRLKEAGENKTALEYDFRYRYETFFARLMEPLITPQAQKKLDGDLARLKQLAEQSN